LGQVAPQAGKNVVWLGQVTDCTSNRQRQLGKPLKRLIGGPKQVY
jgi:hypothetical protein